MCVNPKVRREAKHGSVPMGPELGWTEANEFGFRVLCPEYTGFQDCPGDK